MKHEDEIAVKSRQVISSFIVKGSVPSLGINTDLAAEFYH